MSDFWTDPSGTVRLEGTLSLGAPSYAMGSKTVTAAQLLDLDNTPVEILPAPPGRFYYLIDRFILHYRFVTTPYNETLAGTNLALTYGVGAVSGATEIFPPLLSASDAVNPTELFIQTADAYVSRSLDAFQGYGSWLAAAIEGAPVAIQLGGGASLTGGDGELTVRLLYALINGAPG